ncbi:MAG: head-tail adaptor protein [Chloroflexi bacterium]|nr:head-tail adaptor protein [Chloroflexota bacterium]
MLSSSDLSALRTSLEESLPDTAVVQRVTRTADDMGGFTESWAAAGTAACRVAPLGSRTPEERVFAERIAPDVPWVITLPQGTDVTAEDRVTVGARTFEVLGVLAPRSWEIGRRVVCQEA